MNRQNKIAGQHIDRHPLSDREVQLGVYVKGASVIAGQAQIPGVIATPEGEMRFQAGDYIVTDNPPTHAWPVRQQVFETTYNLSHVLEEGQMPTSEPTEPYKPDLSAPPVNVTELKRHEGHETPMEAIEAKPGETVTLTSDDPSLPEAPQVSQAPRPAKNAPAAKAKPAKPGIADSKSLGLEE